MSGAAKSLTQTLSLRERGQAAACIDAMRDALFPLSPRGEGRGEGPHPIRPS